MANEMYARDISKKICSGKKNFQQQGKFAGSRAPYGYLIDPDDKQHLVIDPETADVVLEMFNMVAGGYTLHRVAVMLNEKGVPSPGRRMYDPVSYTHLDVYKRQAVSCFGHSLKHHLWLHRLNL